MKWFGIAISDKFEKIPFYLGYGKTSILNGIFQALEVYDRTPPLFKITEHLEKNDDKLRSRKLSTIIEGLPNLELHDFIYDHITEDDMDRVKEVWNNFSILRENIFQKLKEISFSYLDLNMVSNVPLNSYDNEGVEDEKLK